MSVISRKGNNYKFLRLFIIIADSFIHEKETKFWLVFL